MQRYILDTNILLGFIRGAEWAKEAHLKYELGNPDHLVFISIVSKGEILALADKFQWGEKKRSELEQVLLQFPSVDIRSDELVRTYAAISAWTEGKHPSSKEIYPEVPKPAVKMGQNDMWIAATSIITKAALITTDKDFDHLHHQKLLQRIYIDH